MCWLNQAQIKHTQHRGVCFPSKRIILSSCWNRFRALNSDEDPALLFSCDLSVHRLQPVCSVGPEGLQNTGKWRESHRFTQSGNIFQLRRQTATSKESFPFSLLETNGCKDLKVCYTSGPKPFPGQLSSICLMENIKERGISPEAQIMCSWLDRRTKARLNRSQPCHQVLISL